MIPLKLFALLLLASQDVYGKCTGSKWCCKGQCGQGEGDCDRDKDCLPGLVCNYDNWFGTDFCKAGPTTKNYEWTSWSDWDECSVSCGGEGDQSRTRKCIPPKNGGYKCPSNTQTQTQKCNNGPCPVNGGWGFWSDWSDCPVSCGGAENSRTRVCDNPAPAHGGDECTIDGSSGIETGKCNENPCPINGGWGEWSSWPYCPVSCGGGTQARSRVCNNPVPQFGGADCTADGSGIWNLESQACNENPCPIDGGFSDWEEWGPCTAPCGGGDQTRTRRCDNPAPQFGGLDCVGDLTDCQRCNTDLCPSTCPA